MPASAERCSSCDRPSTSTRARPSLIFSARYAGDDSTDLDAFNALQALELGVRVAVASPEGPAQLREAADVVVDGPPAMLELLRCL